MREPLFHYRRTGDGMSSRHETMARSHELMLELLLARRRDVSRADLSFTRSNFFVHLANEAHRKGRPREALRWLWRALACDPVRIARRRMLFRIGLRSLGALAAGGPSGGAA